MLASSWRDSARRASFQYGGASTVESLPGALTRVVLSMLNPQAGIEQLYGRNPCASARVPIFADMSRTDWHRPPMVEVEYCCDFSCHCKAGTYLIYSLKYVAFV